MGALILQLEQTLLIFVGIPAAVILIVAAFVYTGGRKSAKRYRPGRGYDYAAVWFTSAPQPAGSDEHHGGTRPALPAGHGEPTRPGEPAATVAVPAAMAVSAPGVTGGASDRW
jgi:hypothetical protein